MWLLRSSFIEPEKKLRLMWGQFVDTSDEASIASVCVENARWKNGHSGLEKKLSDQAGSGCTEQRKRQRTWQCPQTKAMLVLLAPCRVRFIPTWIVVRHRTMSCLFFWWMSKTTKTRESSVKQKPVERNFDVFRKHICHRLVQVRLVPSRVAVEITRSSCLPKGNSFWLCLSLNQGSQV